MGETQQNFNGPDDGTGDFWHTHYDSLAHHESLDLFKAEARDFFRRLTRSIPLRSCEQVLDFGCGLGFVSELLTTRVNKLAYWDYSENMLATAKHRLASVNNAEPVDLSRPDQEEQFHFDLIVVNSVIQYMSEDEFSAWLGKWKEMLVSDGALVISDVILPEPAFFREIFDSLVFSAKKGFLLRTLAKNFSQYLRYLKTRSSAPMSRYSKERFSALINDAGLRADILPDNLTYRTNRFSALVRRLPE